MVQRLNRALVLSLLLGAVASLRSSAAPPWAGQHAPAPVGTQVNAAEATKLFREGSAAFSNGNLTAAHTAFARLVKTAPGIATAHLAFGTVLLAEGAADQALPQLIEAHHLDPSSTQALVELALAQVRTGRFTDAVVSFQTLPPEALHAMTPAETLAYATALANTGQPTTAETLLREALKEASPTAELLDALGSVEAQQSKDTAARANFTAAVQLDPKYAPAHAHLGSMLLLQGAFTDAVTELREALRLGDMQIATSVNLGRALSAVGKDAEAVALLGRTLQAHPDSVDAQYASGLALQAAGQPERALPLFAGVVAKRPEDRGARTNYGLALVQTGDAKGALQQYAHAASGRAPDATLLENMGVAYLQTNDLDRAVEEFRAGLQLEAENPQLHYDLGLAYKLKDDLPGAVQELERAETLDPRLPDPPYTLGVIRMQQGDLSAATQQFRKAVTLKPDNGEAWALLGSVLKDAGSLDESTEALHRATALQPDQPSPHVTLAAVLTAQGNRDGATAERKVAASLSRTAMSRQRASFALQSGRALLAKGDIPGAVLQLNDAIAAQPEWKEAHLLLAAALERQGRPADALAERQKAEHLSATP